jgi:hypothetical protein
MNIPAEFDEIRPYTPEELPAVYDELLADEGFRKVLAYLYPGVPVEAIAQQMHACTTNLAFQKTFCYNFLKQLVAKCATGMEMQWDGLQRSGEHYTFISNHRDIVLDSALLSVLLTDEGFDTTVEIAIGDNLLIYPWIKKLVRINKSFIVQRAATMRQMLQSSARMSRYMHFAIHEKQENVWIAQREGRAKDSNDRTQESILKMMAMGGEGDVIERLKDLNITPLSISYEYDPCDYLKAQEFQQKRDIEGFKKSPADDLANMQTGIFGYKGRISYRTSGCLNAWLDGLDKDIPKTEIFGVIAQHIDEQIHANYVLYPVNYVAADLLEGGDARAAHYTAEEKAGVEKYFRGQLDKIVLPNKDEAFLREKLLLMYANPLFNYEKAVAK